MDRVAGGQESRTAMRWVCSEGRKEVGAVGQGTVWIGSAPEEVRVGSDWHSSPRVSGEGYPYLVELGASGLDIRRI